jgi:hypothetical protein
MLTATLLNSLKKNTELIAYLNDHKTENSNYQSAPLKHKNEQELLPLKAEPVDFHR